jgi:hypothetical protein
LRTVKGFHERLTENPNFPGNSWKRRCNIVDFPFLDQPKYINQATNFLVPVPEGPEITTGRNFWTALDAILNADLLAQFKDLERQIDGRRGEKQCIGPQWRSWMKRTATKTSGRMKAVMPDIYALLYIQRPST